ncbi:hypothetical protein JCM8547_008802 [Rhodosporidiobolus lusitaniae]
MPTSRLSFSSLLSSSSSKPSSHRKPSRPSFRTPLALFLLFLTSIVAYSLYERGLPDAVSEGVEKIHGLVVDLAMGGGGLEGGKEVFREWEEVAYPPGVLEKGEEGKEERLNCEKEEGGCRFLVPTTIGEQESRAQLHLLQLLALSLHLNRTLVLPRLYSSRVSTCGTAGFDFFYELAEFERVAESMGGRKGGVVKQREFEGWLKRQGEKAKARAVRLSVPTAEEPSPPSFSVFLPDSTLGGKPAAPCLDSSLLDFKRGEGSEQAVVMWEERDFNPKPLLEGLKDLEEEVEVDVLLVHYNLRSPLFPASASGDADAAFVYRPEWVEVADLVLDELRRAGGGEGEGEVVGVHWRTEGLGAERLEVCGEALSGAVERVRLEGGEEKGGTGVRAVYLASDFPIELVAGAPSHPSLALAERSDPFAAADDLAHPLLAHSDTLTPFLTPSHFTSLSHFLTSSFPSHNPTTALHTFSSLLPLVLSRLPPSSPLRQFAEHPAARGIVDFLVLARTEVFLSGWPTKGSGQGKVGGRTPCGKSSNWTRRVGRARRVKWEGEGGEKEGKGKEGGRLLRVVQATWDAEGGVEGLSAS